MLINLARAADRHADGRKTAISRNNPVINVWHCEVKMNSMEIRHDNGQLGIAAYRHSRFAQGFNVSTFTVLLTVWPLGARKQSYIRTRHSL